MKLLQLKKPQIIFKLKAKQCFNYFQSRHPIGYPELYFRSNIMISKSGVRTFIPQKNVMKIGF